MPDIGREPVGQTLVVLLLVVRVLEDRAARQLPACQAFAQLLSDAWTRLEDRGEGFLGYFINNRPRECGEFTIQRLTGENSALAEIISRGQAGYLDPAAVLLNGTHQDAVTDDAQGLQDRAGLDDDLVRLVFPALHLGHQRRSFLGSQSRKK